MVNVLLGNSQFRKCHVGKSTAGHKASEFTPKLNLFCQSLNLIILVDQALPYSSRLVLDNGEVSYSNIGWSGSTGPNTGLKRS